MTEKDYILATNIARIGLAIDAIQQVTAGDPEFGDQRAEAQPDTQGVTGGAEEYV